MDVLRAAPATWADEKPAVSWGKHAHKDLPRGKMCCAEKVTFLVGDRGWRDAYRSLKPNSQQTTHYHDPSAWLFPS